MGSPLLLNLLWLLPIGVWVFTRQRPAQTRCLLRGVSIGLIISPASLGLYALYFVGPVAALFGMLGLVLKLVHGSVGYQVAIFLGLVPAHTVITGMDYLPIELINAVFWGAVYGAAGHAWAKIRNRGGNRSAA